jgi:methionyl aminopeptidase
MKQGDVSMEFKEKQDRIMKRLLEYRKKGHRIPGRRLIKSPEQIDGIRESGKVNTAVLDYIADHIRPGMSTEEIDRMVYEKTKELGGIPAPLNYQGFPKSVCTSVNNEICHGIPSEDIILEEGDIVNVDVSTIYKGYYSDSSRMFCIGQVDPEAERLVRVTKECVERGIAQVKPWGFLGDIGQAVNDYAKENGYTVVEDIGGHGVGLEFHEDPYVSFVTQKGTEMVLAPGMVFTIEPMVNTGGPEFFIDEENGWTVYTEDNGLSAQWEVTIAVTDDGYEILAW